MEGGSNKDKSRNSGDTEEPTHREMNKRAKSWCSEKINTIYQILVKLVEDRGKHKLLMQNEYRYRAHGQLTGSRQTADGQEERSWFNT